MYRIDVDMYKKLVTVEVTGNFDKPEVISLITEMKGILNQFGSKEAMLLMLMDRANPVSQDNSLLLTQSLTEDVEYIKKIATIHKRVVTSMQMRRMEKEVMRATNEAIDVGSFYNVRDALIYLGL